MIDVGVIEDEIAAIEAEDETTYETCERLACLYTVRDHLKAKSDAGKSGASEFLTLAVGVPVQDLMKVIDEHMEAIINLIKKYEPQLMKDGDEVEEEIDVNKLKIDTLLALRALVNRLSRGH